LRTRRTVEYLIKRVREELRAEGADGAGYSDFIILDGLNTALDDLSSIFVIRDVDTITSVADQHDYDLLDLLGMEVFEIIRITYDGNLMKGKSIDHYLKKDIKNEGPVRSWFLWGTQLTLIGEVEADKEVKIWLNRGPKFLQGKDDIPDTPRYADEALIAYAMSICYRESKDYERANYHYRIFGHQKNALLQRAVPQLQRDFQTQMRDSYQGPHRGSKRFFWTDTNPRGDY